VTRRQKVLAKGFNAVIHKGGELKKFDLLLITVLLPLSLLSCYKSNSGVTKLIGNETARIQKEIMTVLAHQKKAWNQGNIRGFMADYWNSEDFTFQSGNNRLHGWEALLARYMESYSGEKMGNLDFSEIEIKVLTNDFAYVLGRWNLNFKDSSSQGMFTLIFQRTREGWKIIHDHTS